jgi:hypothetical protein
MDTRKIGLEFEGVKAILGSAQSSAQEVQLLAEKNYRLWKAEPSHPSLQFRRLRGYDDLFTIRVGDHYRALGVMEAGGITWIWIGTHAEYDRIIG